MPKVFRAIIVALLAATLLRADPPPAAPTPAVPLPSAAARPAAELSVADAVILGVIEGLTEFLPVSSTGHLIIAKDLLGLNSQQVLLTPEGEALWHRQATAYHGAELLTLNLAADTYIVMIQFGAIAAVALVCWQQLWSMFMGLLGRDPAGRRLLINVIIAFLPAALIGYAFHDWVDENLFSTGSVIVAQVAGALLMFYVEAWYARRYLQGLHPNREELTPFSAAGIGLLQCVAIWPGTSRPMMVIVGGYFAGLDPRRSAEFSFLLGFVTMTVATVFKTYKNGASMIQVFGYPHVVLGAVVAAVVAAVCVRYFAQLLVRHGLNFFAWYRIAVAAALSMYYFK